MQQREAIVRTQRRAVDTPYYNKDIGSVLTAEKAGRCLNSFHWALGKNPSPCPETGSHVQHSRQIGGVSIQIMANRGLKAIAPVPTASDFLDIVLSKTQRKTPTVNLYFNAECQFLSSPCHPGHPQKLQDQPNPELLHAQGQIHPGLVRGEAQRDLGGIPHA